MRKVGYPLLIRVCKQGSWAGVAMPRLKPNPPILNHGTKASKEPIIFN